jgi:hypothetical protein
MIEEKAVRCEHLQEFLDCELGVIKRHLARHKWFNAIPDEGEGIADFIRKYGWLMRELYCGYACPDRDKCDLGMKVYPIEEEAG